MDGKSVEWCGVIQRQEVGYYVDSNPPTTWKKIVDRDEWLAEYNEGFRRDTKR